MTVALVAGLGVGLGVIGVVCALKGSRRNLSSVLATAERSISLEGTVASTRLGPSPAVNGTERVYQLLGRPIAAVLEDQWPPDTKSRIESSLRVTGTTAERLFSQAFLGGVVGLFLPPLCWAIASAAGVNTPFLLPIWACVAMSIGGAALPFVALSAEARNCRRQARRVVGSFLDLVVLCLAGGMGVEGALHAATQVGDDKTSARLRRTLEFARDSGEPPWNALATLGTELGVAELTELAAAVGLAGAHGARIRSTLAAKATSIRRHELADLEAQANATTERLFLPGVLLLLGFLLFIGYPAVARIAGGL